MRILIVNVQIGSGSAGSIVSDLYEGIVASGNECKIAFSRGEIRNVPKEDTIKIGNRIDICLHALKSRLFGRTATYSKISTKLFLNEVDKFVPDIIHIHGIYGYYLNMKMLFDYIRRNNIGLVSTLHSCWDFTGHCCYFDYIGCMQWKNKCENCPQINSYPKSVLFENSSKNLYEKKELYKSLENVIIVSPSKWMDELVSESILAELKREVIKNGVDTSVFENKIDWEYIESIGADKNIPTILAVASIWNKKKGYDDIIELAEYLKGEEFNIIVVGLSKKQIANVPNNVIGIERTDNREQLRTLYSFATVLFNPTYEDNYPTVNLESIACGTPVVTYGVGGSAEVIVDLNAGAIVDKKNYGLIKKTVEKYRKKGFLNRSILDSIDSKRMVDDYLVLYNQMESVKKGVSG